jgi:hypothetical protein
MKRTAMLITFSLVVGVGSQVHAGCASSACTTDEQSMAPAQVAEPLGSRIESALTDLEIAKARAFKGDEERIKAICAAMNCARPELTVTTPLQATCNTGSC